MVVAETLEQRARTPRGLVRAGTRTAEHASLDIDRRHPARLRARAAERSEPPTERGDVERGARADASASVEATYTTPIEHHNPMEPHATDRRWQGDGA